MLTGNDIPAGGEGKVAVNLKAGNQRRGIRQVVNVTTNAPDAGQASFTLTLQANVQADLAVLPRPVLRLGNQQEGENDSFVTLKNYSASPIQLRDVLSSNQYVTLALSSMTIPANGEVTLSAKLLPDTPKGLVSGWITLKTDLPSFPLVEIRLFGEVL
ncbi:hypothetical protein U14_03753 [Candidatus Moduliflexus flocculans]|uniref:DUF1573 domain-containing protein n=1 Tax=Candidatus Moduliflexus flocculans TaxID=1499966 RepID=A0A081BQ36_9BACT|nr:hypothetical protein U14_03753 [Candidatus Moduliflexus flocculans]